MKSLTAVALFGNMVKRSLALSKWDSLWGKWGLIPLAFSTASGNLAGWAVARVTMGLVPDLALQSGGKTDGAVGIQKFARCFQGLGNGFGGLSFVYCEGVKFLADGRQFLLADGEGAGLGQARHQAANGTGIAPVGLIQQALEIARNLDIHGGAGSLA